MRRYSIYDGIETENPNFVKRVRNGIMSNRAKRFAKYYNQCKLPKWATVLGIVLLAFGIVAAGVTAIFHDKYSSIFGLWRMGFCPYKCLVHSFYRIGGRRRFDLARISTLDVAWRLDLDIIRKAGAGSCRGTARYGNNGS